MEFNFKVGQTVRLRNGTIATVTDNDLGKRRYYPVKIIVINKDKGNTEFTVTRHGLTCINGRSEFDVIAIIHDPNEPTTIIKSDKTVDEIIEQFVEINGFTPNTNEVLKRFVTFANQDAETNARYRQFLELKKEFGE